MHQLTMDFYFSGYEIYGIELKLTGTNMKMEANREEVHIMKK